jgi:hypothetical protein
MWFANTVTSTPTDDRGRIGSERIGNPRTRQNQLRVCEAVINNLAKNLSRFASNSWEDSQMSDKRGTRDENVNSSTRARVSKNRFALEGEELIAHRFGSGLIRMLSRDDYCRWRMVAEAPSARDSSVRLAPGNAFLGALKHWLMQVLDFLGLVAEDPFSSGREPGPVVEFPDDALLRVYGISQKLQQQYHLSSFEDALAIEITHRLGRGRDALCFGNGAILSLQALEEGQRVKVLYRSWTESLDPSLDPAQVNL